MRLATLALAMLGLLLVSATFAVAQERAVNGATTLDTAPASNEAVVTPVRWYRYGPAPGWNESYRYYRPYYPVRPRYYYWYGQPRYYGYNYYVEPYQTYYYYPNGFQFQYRGPRRSFGFGF